MALVADITIDHDGNPTSGDGDILVGDRAEVTANLAAKLANIGVADAEQRAAAIVDSHRVVAPGEPIPAVEVAEPAAEEPAAE